MKTVCSINYFPKGKVAYCLIYDDKQKSHQMITLKAKDLNELREILENEKTETKK